MPKPEIIGSLRSSYTRVVCMVCEEKGIEYVLTEKLLRAPAVAKTGYLVDDRFTFADINLLPILYYVRLFPEGAQALAAASHLAGYYERHAARPSFKSTIPPPGPPSRSTSALEGARRE